MRNAIRRRWFWAGVLIFACCALLLWRPFWYELRGYAVLEHFEDTQATEPLLRLLTYRVVTENVTLPLGAGPVPARLYVPVGVPHPYGMVVIHGIHRLGMDEPRLVRFSRAVAEDGFEVLTPELSALADYHVSSESIPIVGESTGWLEQRLGNGPVALTGISFGGGLSLLAACDPEYAPHIRVLAVMGAYDGLSRVSRFLVTNQAELPDGRTEPYAAYEYGALVFVYAHLGQFFSPQDLPTAHDALRYWLWEQPQQAQMLLPKLSGAARARMELLFSHRVDDLRPQILQAIAEDRAELEAISPDAKMAGLRVPLFILHGAADDIIPSTESLWLEKEVPRRDLKAALITPAFDHVDPAKHVGWLAEMRLINFIARFLRAAG